MLGSFQRCSLPLTQKGADWQSFGAGEQKKQAARSWLQPLLRSLAWAGFALGGSQGPRSRWVLCY